MKVFKDAVDSHGSVALQAIIVVDKSRYSPYLRTDQNAEIDW